MVTTFWDDSKARVWDAARGTLLTTLNGHTAPVNSATFSADGTRVVTTSDDKTARVWDASLESAVAALIVFQVLFFLQGSFSMVQQGAPVLHRLLLTLGIVLTCNAGVELAKWAIVEFGVKARHFRIPHFLIDLMGWIALVTASLLVISKIFDFALTGLLVSSTVVSAIIALSLQQLLSSLFAGLALQLEGPFQVDDWVEVGGQEGQVVRLNWRTLTLVTRRNEWVILPNGSVAQGKIVNYSKPNVIVADDVCVGVAYAYPPGEVKTVLRQVLAGLNGIEATPEPEVVVLDYTSSAINYRIRYWFRDYDNKTAWHDTVATRIWYALYRAGMGPSVGGNVSSEEVERRISDALRPVALFETLAADQITQIAAGARLQRYTTGETLVREGEAGDSLFVIKAGRVGVSVTGMDGRQVMVAQRGVGECFGEMSLLTGASRSASVMAALEVAAYFSKRHAVLSTVRPLRACPGDLRHAVLGVGYGFSTPAAGQGGRFSAATSHRSKRDR
jgi:small-conductance mechanosensitive channel